MQKIIKPESYTRYYLDYQLKIFILCLYSLIGGILTLIGKFLVGYVLLVLENANFDFKIRVN